MKKIFGLLSLALFTLAIQIKAQTLYGVQIDLETNYPTENFSASRLIYICGETQTLEVFNTDSLLWIRESIFSISTSKVGFGETPGSDRTPRGLHTITEMIGADADTGRIFRGRQPNEIGKIYTDSTDLEEDWVTSRIMWLSGLEDHNKTSHSRYIYIHGTQEEGLIGTPQSHGCIRMKNGDVIKLFDSIGKGALVYITEYCVAG